jgi:UDP-N-acetylmuramoylalanine--D-glutamate ligase
MSEASGTFNARERVLVIGLGRSGLASAAVLRERGATVIATDDKPLEELTAALATLGGIGVRFVAPSALDPEFAGLTSAVLSPGIPLTNALVRRVQAARISVYSEIEVAYRISRAPIVALTGTKGKSTTTALIGALFRRAGLATYVGGNIGNPLIRETATAEPGSWVIAEVSSFQLESIRSFKPRISALINISPDHLDRYHSMDEYAEAKFRIFANQGPGDTFVGNRDDPLVAAVVEGDAAKRLRARILWFSRTAPRGASLYVRNERIVYAPPSGDPRSIEIMPVSEIPLLGAHNVENVLAALLVGLAADLNPEALRAGVRDFAPLSHRLQFVAEIEGVRYIDDSKATNPGSVIAALRAFDAPIVLIAGGKAKGTDFGALGVVASERAKAVIVIGEAADAIASTVARDKVRRAGSMAEAVQIAREIAKPGDVVLLSPGCASFDMFASAEARGEEFARAVAPAKAAQGA